MPNCKDLRTIFEISMQKLFVSLQNNLETIKIIFKLILLIGYYV